MVAFDAEMCGDWRRGKTKRKPESSTVHYLLFVKILYNISRSNDGWAIKAYSYFGLRAHILRPYRTQCPAKEIRFSMANLLRSRLIKTLLVFFFHFHLRRTRDECKLLENYFSRFEITATWLIFGVSMRFAWLLSNNTDNFQFFSVYRIRSRRSVETVFRKLRPSSKRFKFIDDDANILHQMICAVYWFALHL